MISLVRILIRAYGWLVPPPEPECCHGLGIMICELCPQASGPVPCGTGRWHSLERGAIRLAPESYVPECLSDKGAIPWAI